MSIFLSNFVQVAQGPRNKPVPPMLNDVITIPLGSGTVTISEKQFLIFVVTAVLLVAFWASGAEDARSAARSAPASRTGAWRRCSASTSTAPSRSPSSSAARSPPSPALMFMIYYGVVNFTDGFTPGVKAFTAAVLGGIGSLPGAVIGGLLIGLIETMWSAYFSIDYKDVAAFSILAIVLIFMPSGLLGRPDVEKV